MRSKDNFIHLASEFRPSALKWEFHIPLHDIDQNRQGFCFYKDSNCECVYLFVLANLTCWKLYGYVAWAVSWRSAVLNSISSAASDYTLSLRFLHTFSLSSKHILLYQSCVNIELSGISHSTISSRLILASPEGSWSNLLSQNNTLWLKTTILFRSWVCRSEI